MGPRVPRGPIGGPSGRLDDGVRVVERSERGTHAGAVAVRIVSLVELLPTWRFARSRSLHVPSRCCLPRTPEGIDPILTRPTSLGWMALTRVAAESIMPP